jgi:hypothetical protein
MNLLLEILLSTLKLSQLFDHFIIQSFQGRMNMLFGHINQSEPPGQTLPV